MLRAVKLLNFGLPGSMNLLTFSLPKTPLGWDNIQHFLRLAQHNPFGQNGCFAVCALRDFPIIPEPAQSFLLDYLARLRSCLLRNVANNETQLSPEIITEFVLTLFLGLCFEPALSSDTTQADTLIVALKSLYVPLGR
jgi:hypothetical protein